MRKALIYIFLSLGLAVSAMAQETVDSLALSAVPRGAVVNMQGSFLQPLQQRDSVLIADQVFYGIELKQVEEGTVFGYPQFKDTLMTNIRIVEPWRMDTVKVKKQKKGQPRLMDLKGGVTITSFDEGIYYLPPLAVVKLNEDGSVDSLVFDPQKLEVKTMPVDTATFEVHDIKGQIRYPVTFKEVAPWTAGGLALAGLIALAIWLIVKHSRKSNPEYQHKDPPHIVALRELDKYRGNAMWVPEKQKVFYSGITDALREYIDARYGIGAMEMTTAEIFSDMKDTDVPKELQDELRELFERADFVKFAKFTASDEDNAGALPLAVRFVTSTYQTDVEDVNMSLGGAQATRQSTEENAKEGGE